MMTGAQEPIDMKRILLLVILCAAFLGTCPASAQITAGDMSITPSEGTDFAAESRLSPGLLRGARLHVYDGKTKTAVSLSAPKVSLEGNASQISFATNLPLTVRLRQEPQGRCIVWQVSCRNMGAGQLWLELGPELRLQPSGKIAVFDGWDDFASPSKAIISERIEGNFPAVAFWNEQASLCVGIAPSELVSYFRHEYEPLPDGAARLACLARIVVDPGEEETVKFITCAAPGEWGKYETMEAYYDSFPSWFVARPDVDLRASMGSSEYRAYPVTEWSPEICRRLWAGWEWCYAPFRRTGDIAVQRELWDYKPARKPDKRRSLPCDQFHAWRRQAFTDGEKKCNIAMMFYIPSQIWCEETLARGRYADALTTDPKAKTYFDTPWCTGHDNELRVFPLGTSLAEQSYKDIRQVAGEVDLSGFAFDTAGDAVRYIGPALPKLPCRAWDDQVGVYGSELVAIARLMDFVHTLKKGGKALAVVANPMANGTYASCFHCDSAMLEGTPWQVERTLGDRLRWKMGHKTLVWWESYEAEEFMDAATAKPEQLRAVYRGLADFTLLQSLRLGFVPTPAYTQGFKKLASWLPAITECVHTGWQPVPAARVPEPLWASRYGRGLKTLIAVAHETKAPVSCEVIVENARISDGVLLFSRYDGAALTNTIAGAETALRLKVPVRTPILIRAQAEVVPASAVSRAEVSEELGISKGVLKASLSGAGRATVRVRVPEDMRVSAVAWNGATTEFSETRGVAEFSVEIGPQAHLEVQLISTLFALADNDLMDFPFVKDGKPNCVIVILPNAVEIERLMAWRVQEYFRYWYGRAVKPATQVIIPIQEGNKPTEGRAVVLGIRAGQVPRVALEGEQLVVVAPNSEQLKAVVFKLLRALDRRYAFPDLLPGTTLNKSLGLADTILE
jgi:hypothetical protein